MPDLSIALKETSGWATLAAWLSRREMPHTWAIRVDPARARETVRILAHLFLCPGGSGSDGCPTCGAWRGEDHPDLVEAGAPGAPPGIGECREITGELYLALVAGKRKVAVIHAADRLSLPAANSLLKGAEEPPTTVLVWLLLESDSLLPTLRSRACSLDLRPRNEKTDYGDSPPVFPQDRDPGAWGTWLLSPEWGRDRSADRFRQDLQTWSLCLSEQGALRQAEVLEIIRALGEGQRLSLPMMQDLICLALKEDYPIENVLNALW